MLGRSGSGWMQAPSLTLHPPLPGSRLAEPGVSPAPPCSLEQDSGLLCGAAAGGGVWEFGGPDGTSANGCVLLQGSFGVQGSPCLYWSLNALRAPGWSCGSSEMTLVGARGQQNSSSGTAQGCSPIPPPNLLILPSTLFLGHPSFQPRTSASVRPLFCSLERPSHLEAAPFQSVLFQAANHIPLPLQTPQILPVS